MCGIVGIVGRSDVNQDLYDALTVLQHRGQDAAGIFTCDRRVHRRKANGLVRDVFQQHHMDGLHGRVGIGHIRYPTAGSESAAQAQPFYTNSPYGIALAHNGNLVNAGQLGDEVFREDLRQLNTESDSEILLNVFASELARARRLVLDEDAVFEAVAGVHRRATLADGTRIDFGVHGPVKAHYRLDAEPDLPLPVDYLVAAAAG